MQLKLGKLIVVTSLVMAAAMIFAQGGGGGGGGRFGGGQGGRFGMGQAGPTQLATRGDVQKDLGVTDDQKSKIAALNDKLREERRAMMQELMGGGQPDRAAMTAAMEKFNAKSKEE